MDWTVKELRWGSPEYQGSLELRNRILRQPLGLDLYGEDRSGEPSDIHIGAFHGRRLAGILILSPLGGGEVRMRQVAVSEDCRGMGVGSRMVRYAEALARGRGFHTMRLNARKTAAGFYLRLGYRVSGAELTEVTIPHLPMEKTL